MPALAAAYATGEPGWGRRAAAEDMVMMHPRPAAFMPGRTLRMVRNVAVRFTSIDARHASSVICSIGPGGTGLPPALATRTSTGPARSSISASMRSTCAASVRSATTAMARPPSASI